MKNLLLTFILGSIFSVSANANISNHTNESEYINATTTKSIVSASEQVIDIKIESNGTWNLYLPANPDLVKEYCQPCSGHGDSTFKVSLKSNKTTTTKNFEIDVKLQSNESIGNKLSFTQMNFLYHDSYNNTLLISTDNSWYIQSKCQPFYTLSATSGVRSDIPPYYSSKITYNYRSDLDDCTYGEYRDTLTITDGIFSEKVVLEKSINISDQAMAYWGDHTEMEYKSNILNVSRDATSEILQMYLYYGDNVKYKISTDDPWIFLSSTNGEYDLETWKVIKNVSVNFPATDIERLGRITVEWFDTDKTGHETSIGKSLLYVCQNPANNSPISNISKIDSEKSIVCFPNPFSDIINVKSSYLINDVIVRDINGKEETFNISGNDVQIEPSLKGLLFVEMRTSNGIFTQKVIRK